MGLTIEQAAAGMYRVACNNMAQGVREVTIKRGFDPREFPLIPGGGAGPIHGCLICSELEIPLQIVPREASVLCAFGMLMCELRHDFVRTFVARLEGLDWARLAALVRGDGGRRHAACSPKSASRQRASASNCGSTAATSSSTTRCRCRCRWRLIERRDAAAIARAFHAEHQRLYGYSLRGRGLAGGDHQRARCRRSAPPTARPTAARPPAPPTPSAALKGRRSVYIPERDAFAEVPVYDGHRMRCGHRIAGPALVEQQTTAIFVSDSYDCVVDALGSFVLYAKGREDLLEREPGPAATRR